MRRVFIKSAVSISVLDSFLQEDLSQLSVSPNGAWTLKEPNYRDYVAPAMLRRASKMMKMSLASSQTALEQSGIQSPDSIIVGTGLGGMTDTVKFLEGSIRAEEGSLIAPGAFIQSGHNSVSGQIALLLKNQQYNMTHVQKGLSFEYALLDAMLRVKEGDDAVLLGAVDEKIGVLDQLAERMTWPEDMRRQLSEGCSFFVVEGEAATGVEIVEVKISKTEDLLSNLDRLLEPHSLNLTDSVQNFVGYSELPKADLPFAHQVYTDRVGRYFSSSAFGFHLASDTLKHQGKPGDFATVIHFSDLQFSSIMLLRRV
ncbi:beta-ketoacyl synthase chain length factor [Reichenbachiella agariperforans]|uniref:beta-ketoacyl synthase chain length factor n=1 Tax=Reichenbachiella agariperforans TaxID=156994 RepID=UPI001C0A4EEF|nr:beta-ketoacyl synthase chain length factor [Reichenbachiella agariperforans]MBU2913006.1 beta-ketoacyl synthase chain length factor [Reichenbachiella agariperforans]